MNLPGWLEILFVVGIGKQATSNEQIGSITLSSSMVLFFFVRANRFVWKMSYKWEMIRTESLGMFCYEQRGTGLMVEISYNITRGSPSALEIIILKYEPRC